MNAAAAIGALAETVPAASAAVREVELSEEELALSRLERIDYYDAFLARTDLVRRGSGEDWARAVLEGAPAAIRGVLQAGWTSLGLKLGSTPPERFVLGWELQHSDADHALLAAGSRLGLPGELLFKRRSDGLVLATFVCQENATARAMWAGTAPVHRRVVPHILDLTVAA